MQRFVLTLSLVTMAISGRAYAQKPTDKDFVPPPPAFKAERAVPRVALDVERQEPSPSDLQGASMPPEMWLYLHQERRYDDPKQAVRRKAEQRTAERRARLAAMAWYGYSNLRPTASATPWMSTYSPTWVGNSWDPFRHVGMGYPAVGSLQSESYEWRR